MDRDFSSKWCEARQATILDESADFWGIGLGPNFFSIARIFLAELATESWRDLAADSGKMADGQHCWHPTKREKVKYLDMTFKN
jgi:hypothetical protein